MTAAVAPTSDPYAKALGDRRFGGRVAYYNPAGHLDPAAVANDVGVGKADVIVMGPDVAMPNALAMAQHLDQQHPEIAVVLVASPAADLWKVALESGVWRIVRLGAPPSEVVGVVQTALERADRRRSNAVRENRDRTSGETEAVSRRAITVLSPKGGSGKTTVATNLAAGLAALHPDQVAIVDLDLQFGDVADAFLLDPTHTLADLPRAGEVDGAGVKLLLTSTGKGLHVLCGPDDPATGEEIPLDRVARAIEALAADFSFLVMDTGAGIDPVALSAAERSTDLVFVGSLEVPSVRSVQKLIVALDRLGITDAQRHVVLNRANSKVGITAKDVTTALGLPIAIELPSSLAVPTSLNRGTPVILADPSSSVARALQHFVACFTEVPARRSRFRRNR
jgi:pilus assembly protein CpaE